MGEASGDGVRHKEAALAPEERNEGMGKYEALKRNAIEENERMYGREARARYGDDAVDAANERLASLSRDEWDEKDRLEQAIKEQLRAAMATGDPAGDAARELAQMHESWIRLHWGEGHYSREAHCGLAQMYLADERFRVYYDTGAGEGATEFLVAALESYLA
ncbi:TipAS antibiotic-recognition domain-containing protein [Olsenella uli]|nr:TipAS antibiotic-recognition domain-containing protein [Olsenella uli]